MDTTKLEKLVRASGKATSKGLDALARYGVNLRGNIAFN
jgi:hypothetical protein